MSTITRLSTPSQAAMQKITGEIRKVLDQKVQDAVRKVSQEAKKQTPSNTASSFENYMKVWNALNQSI